MRVTEVTDLPASLSRACRRVSALAAMCLALAGCAVGDFQKPVQALSDAATAAQEGLIGYNEALTTQIRVIRRQHALALPAGVNSPVGDCLSTSTRCRLEARRIASAAPQSLSPAQPIPRIVALITEIKNYAGGLKAIVESDSRAKVEASLASANGSLQNLAKLVESPDQNLQGFSAPITAAAGWVIGVYIDHLRYEALQTATRNADPLIQQSAVVFETVATQAFDASRAAFADTVTARRNEFLASPGETSLTRLIAAADDYDKLLGQPPAPVFRNLAKAHESLAKALNKEIRLETAFGQLQAVKDEAEKFKAVIDAFIKAAEQKPG